MAPDLVVIQIFRAINPLRCKIYKLGRKQEIVHDYQLSASFI